jgi:hypothetical protein
LILLAVIAAGIAAWYGVHAYNLTKAAQAEHLPRIVSH